MNVHQSAVPILVVLAPLLASFLLPVVGWRFRSAVFPLTLTALAFSCATAFEAARRVALHGPLHYYLGGWAPPWGIELRIDALGALMLLLITVITLLVGIYSKRSVLQEIRGCPGCC
jgi:multicomponent Na+:H+ antiporter subunit D